MRVAAFTKDKAKPQIVPAESRKSPPGLRFPNWWAIGWVAAAISGTNSDSSVVTEMNGASGSRLSPKQPRSKTGTTREKYQCTESIFQCPRSGTKGHVQNWTFDEASAVAPESRWQHLSICILLIKIHSLRYYQAYWNVFL